jgi:hypothetical protein
MEEVKSRICTKCGKEKPLEEFSRNKQGKYGRRAFCKECEHKIQNSPERLARRNELRKLRRENDEYRLARNLKDTETRHKNEDSIKKALVRAAKARAKKKGIPFDITIEDFILPEKCPLLEIPLTVGYGSSQENSYSLDKIIPDLGYVKGNVWVISNKANMIKNNASLEELKLLVKNLETHWIH